MPRTYIKKTPSRTLVPEEKIIAAKILIAEGKSKRFAADAVGIHEATLRKRLKTGHVPTSLGRFKPTFTKDQEAEFAVHCQLMDERFFGITISDLRRLAYEFAEANNINHRFDHSTKTAGRDWVEGFLKRNPILGVRQSAPVSLARAIGFNRVQVKKFYANLKEIYDKYHFRPHRIYNMDETGMSTVPKKTPKVVAPKGKRVVGKIVSSERGITITAVMCMSATGHFVPPALIFPRKRPKAELLDGGPRESICMVSDSGYINSTLFINWLTHFKDFARPSKEDPVLLIMDSHSSHISLDALNYAREHNIIMLTIPPHGSHKLQPLDVAVHSPLKTKYAIECEKWTYHHPGRGTITQFQVAGLFNNAFKKAATIANAESGFKATGIYPFADDLFDDTDFAPASVTNQVVEITETPGSPVLQNNNVIDNNDYIQPLSSYITDKRGDQPTSVEKIVLPESPSILQTYDADCIEASIDSDTTIIDDESMNQNEVTARFNMSACHEASNNASSNKERGDLSQKDDNDFNVQNIADLQRDDPDLATTTAQKDAPIVTVAQLSPLPRMKEKKNRTRPCLKSEIITSSPYKKQLEEKKKLMEQKTRHVKQVNFDDIGSPGPTGTQKRKTRLTGKTKATASQPKLSTSRSQSKRRSLKEVEEYFCPVCDEKYEEPLYEDWIICVMCRRWFHEKCTAYEPGMSNYVCDFCE